MKPDRNKVIEGLEEVIAEAVYPDRPRKFMMSLELAEDALALLKAQEPRVMTLEEATEEEVVWYDWRTLGVRPAKVNRVPSKAGTYRVQRFGDIDDWVHADEYGEYWRCWTSKPTDAQMEAIPWE